MRGTALLLLSVALACHACARASARYIVSATPFHLIATGHPGFCVAVDPADAHGVWGWEPGRSGCSSRSTGPKVFSADRAKVAKTSRAPNVQFDVQFEVQLMERDPLQVRLTVEDDGMRREASGERVSVERRRDLDMPESCCPPPSQPRAPSSAL